MNIPLVSVLVTSYNREKYIGDCIESILNSNFQDFELLVIDDCSTDATVSIVKAHQLKDPRIKLYINEKNLGQFQNRNKAASLAAGKYIKYLDSDDILYPFALDVMYKAMELSPEAGLGFCYTSGKSPWPLPCILSPKEAYEYHYLGGGLLFTGPSGLIFSRDVFWKVGGYEEYGMPSDNHLTLKIAAVTPVVALPGDLFWWRQHDDQAFNEADKLSNVLNTYRFNLNLLESIKCPLDIKLRRQMRKTFVKLFFLNLLNKGIFKFKFLESYFLVRGFLR